MCSDYHQSFYSKATGLSLFSGFEAVEGNDNVLMCRFITADIPLAFKMAESHPLAQAALLHLL